MKNADIDLKLKFIIEKKEKNITYFKGSEQRCVYEITDAIKIL